MAAEKADLLVVVNFLLRFLSDELVLVYPRQQALRGLIRVFASVILVRLREIILEAIVAYADAPSVFVHVLRRRQVIHVVVDGRHIRHLLRLHVREVVAGALIPVLLLGLNLRQIEVTPLVHFFRLMLEIILVVAVGQIARLVELIKGGPLRRLLGLARLALGEGPDNRDVEFEQLFIVVAGRVELLSGGGNLGDVQRLRGDHQLALRASVAPVKLIEAEAIVFGYRLRALLRLDLLEQRWLPGARLVRELLQLLAIHGGRSILQGDGLGLLQLFVVSNLLLGEIQLVCSGQFVRRLLHQRLLLLRLNLDRLVVDVLLFRLVCMHGNYIRLTSRVQVIFWRVLLRRFSGLFVFALVRFAQALLYRLSNLLVRTQLVVLRVIIQLRMLWLLIQLRVIDVLNGSERVLVQGLLPLERVIHKQTLFQAFPRNVELTLPVLNALIPVALVVRPVRPIHFAVPVPKIL